MPNILRFRSRIFLEINLTVKMQTPTYDAELQDSDFLTGMMMRDAAEVVVTDLEGYGRGKRKVNYKCDAAFSRQRYWGEPFDRLEEWHCLSV